MYIQTRKENIATVWKFHATVDELKTSMENLAMDVGNSSTSLFRLREEVLNTISIRHEEMATNEETIKDV